jgi:putative ABC transport system permease protein
LLVCEALWLALAASVLGMLAGHLLTGLIGLMLQAERSLPMTGWVGVPAEALVPLAAAGVAVVAALVPAWAAYRVDVAQLLGSR